MFSPEQERLLKISLERSKGNDEKLQKPALEADKEGMLLSRLQSQWLLFGSFAALTFLLTRLEKFQHSDASNFYWASIYLFLGCSLLAWLSIQRWATYYFNKSEYFSKF